MSGTAPLLPWQVKRAQAMMVSDLRENIPLAALADACRLSKCYFVHAFHLAVGTSPHQWLIGKRLEEAKKLLECAELNMTDVAVLSGFRDAGHLADIFRKHEGMKPSEWRLAQRRQRALARVMAEAPWT